ncbi:MAG: glycosyltransferase [Candidatus Aureabacteria bacterium]|nr:glycosyltransferase [Candidatus Auribacterota bacterium]
MPDLTISLVIPVYNAEKDIDHLFQSLVNQTHPLDEIILVDNNSRDRSLEKCNKFKSDNPDRNIIVLTETKKGPSAVRNAGLRKATSGILALTDADCMLDKDWCKNVLERFEKDILYDILGGIAAGTEIFGKEQTFESYTEEFCYYYWTKNRQSKAAYPMNRVDDFFSSAAFTVATYNVAMKRHVFEKTSGFDETLLNQEDTDWWMRCCQHGFKSLVGIPEIRVCHRNRKELRSLYRQYYNYGEGLPLLLKKFFRGRFLITFRSQKIMELHIFTGLMEINPHTLLLFLILFHILFFPPAWIFIYFLALFSVRSFLIYSYIRNFTRPGIKKVLAFVFIMEARQTAWSVAAFRGMFKYGAFYLI